MIQEDLKFVSTLKEQCEIIWNFYLSRRLSNNFEPSWIHSPYQIVNNFLENKEVSDKESFILREVVKSHQQKDGSEVPVKTGFPNEGIRIMHDCWKAGSFTWIFMGRIYCDDIHSYKNHVIINRKLPDEIYDLTDKTAPQTIFAAYNLDDNKFHGPAIYLDQLTEYLDQQVLG